MLTSRPGTTITFLAGAPAACLMKPRTPARPLDGGLVGAGRHRDGAAQLAVDLQHQLDLVLLQRAASTSGQGASSRSPCAGRVAELLTTGVRDVRRGRVQAAQQDAEAFAQRRIGAGVAAP
jgi:hypothetical protein